MRARADALDIAIMLMKRHLEAATPDGAGRESVAYQMAAGRVSTLEDLKTSLEGDAPDFLAEPTYPDRADDDPRQPLPDGARVETIFEARVQGDLPGAQRALLTTRILRMASRITGQQVLVIGRQEVFPAEEAPEPDDGL
jgi:hypothetical protein